MRILLAFLLISTGLKAAEITARLLNFEREGGDISTLFVVDEKGVATECRLTRDELSKPVKLPVLDGALVFRKEAGGDPIATAKVPQDIKLALVIFLPPNDKKMAFRPVVLDGSDKSFPPGSSLVMNLYNEDVRFILGEHKIQLKSGKTTTLARPQKRDNFNMAGVTFQFKTNSGWRAAYESMSRFPEGQRHLYIAYVDPKSQRPRIRAYRD